MLKKILLFLILLSQVFFWNNLIVNANYDLTKKDEKVIILIGNKAFQLIDSWKIWEQRLVDILKIYNQKKVKSERLKEIINIVIDDIEYEYYLWDYFDDWYEELDEDFWEEFSDENFNWWFEFWKWDNYIDDEWNNYSYDEWNISESEYSNIEAIYKINWDNIIFISGKQDEKHLNVFKMFTNLLPKKQRKDFKLFIVDNSPKWDTFAHVIQDRDEISKWNITVNIGLFYVDWKLNTKESVYTLIHEYSHVLTLGKYQMDYNNFDNCEQILLQEWCLNKDSYFNSFINKFWLKDFAASQKYQDNDFYSWQESDFVNDYASSNPWEDIAESFTAFVLNNKPTWTTIADKKKLFFYNFQEIVKLRSVIRSKLSALK